MQASKVWNYIKKTLHNAEIIEFESESKIIFEHFTKFKPWQIIIEDFFVPEKIFASIQNCVNTRITGKPLAYISKKQNFYGHDFALNNECLIPRFDSEILVEQTLNNFTLNDKNNIIICDLCCGSGCLGISLAYEIAMQYKNIKINLQMIDISKNALKIANKNANHILKNCNVDIEILPFNILKDDFVKITKSHIIITNPPYIPSHEIEGLEKQVKNFEPKIALDGGLDGFNFYRIIANNLSKICYKNTLVGIEFGIHQDVKITELFSKYSKNINICKDLCNIPRCGIFKFDL